MSQLSDQAKNNYKLRIKPRLDGRYILVLSGDKPAYLLTLDKQDHYHVYAKSKEWEFRMNKEGGIQDYLSELLNCFKAYRKEVSNIELHQGLLVYAFSVKKSPTI